MWLVLAAAVSKDVHSAYAVTEAVPVVICLVKLSLAQDVTVLVKTTHYKPKVKN